MLVDHLDRIGIAPGRCIRAPRLDIADKGDFRVTRLDGIVESLVALGIMVETKIIGVVIVVFVANLQQAEIERLGMARGQLCPGVVSVPAEIDDNIARRKLKAMGVSIDSLSCSQKEYLNG